MSGQSRQPDGYVDPNFPNPNGPNDTPIIIYGYTPSFVLAVLAVILFSLSSIIHGFQLFRYRTWYFTTIIVATIMEVAGYIARTLSAKLDPYYLIYFVVQYFFIVSAPVFLSAAIYAVISVLINRVGREYSPLQLPPRAILWLFIASDIVSSVIQILGAALIGVRESKNQDPTVPNDILLTGLVVQVFSFSIFIALVLLFLWRARRVFFFSSVRTGREQQQQQQQQRVGKEQLERRLMPLKVVSRSFILAFLVATLAVYLRTCYRLAETARQSYTDKSRKQHEALFGVLEFAPVVVCVWILNFWHPGRCIYQAGLTS